MTVTQVRLLPDGEELVLVESPGPPVSSETDPREAALDRRNQPIWDDGGSGSHGPGN